MRMRSVERRLGVVMLVCLVATVQSYGGCEEECEAHFGSFRSIRCDHEVGRMCVMKEMHYNARKLTFTTFNCLNWNSLLPTLEYITLFISNLMSKICVPFWMHIILFPSFSKTPQRNFFILMIAKRLMVF